MQLAPGSSLLETALDTIPGKPITWGQKHHCAFEREFDHVAGFGICGDDLLREDSRVTLSGIKMDRDGMPAPKMTYHIDDAMRRMLDCAMDRAAELLHEAGAEHCYPVLYRNKTGFHDVRRRRLSDTAVPLDICDPVAVDRVFADRRASSGRLDVLANVADVIVPHTLEATTPAEFDRILGINLMGTFLCRRAAIAPMRPAGRGSIINTSSASAPSRSSSLSRPEHFLAQP